jgi:hypothetical protein
MSNLKLKYLTDSTVPLLGHGLGVIVKEAINCKSGHKGPQLLEDFHGIS